MRKLNLPYPPWGISTRVAVLCILLGPVHLSAQAPAPSGQGSASAKPAQPAAAAQPGNLKIGKVTVSGSVRFRVEAWNWFDGAAENTYAYPQYIFRLSLSQKFKKFDWQVEGAQPSLFGLPDNAIAAGAQGQFGLGASYFAANNRHQNVGNAFIKQAFVRFNQLGGKEGFSFRLGRFEFIDGAEVTPKDPALAWIKGQRIAHRLLGNFGFTNVGRSFDGVHLNLSSGKTNFTLAAMRPTRGVFQVDGWGEMDIDVVYGALTRQVVRKSDAGELRVFGMGYHDGRRILKTDNRPQAVRAADLQKIRIGAFGAHYLHNFNTSKNGKFDFLVWGTLQAGGWGALDHRAGAIAVEAGWQPPSAKLKPWVRFGYLRGSGDDNAADNKHGTFFQMLPTPRVYSRFPFYNFQNSQDISGVVILRPTAKFNVRSEFHGLKLTERSDLWYLGGGAFQNTSFGYVGRPSGGSSDFGRLWDASADYQVNPRVGVGFYFGAFWGGNVIRSIYPAGKNSRFGYTELTYRF